MEKANKSAEKINEKNIPQLIKALEEERKEKNKEQT